MGKIVVRDVDASEVNQVLKLIDQYDRPKSPPPTPEQQRTIIQNIRNSGGRVIGAFIDNLLVGTCTLNICANLSWSGRPYGIIENVIIDYDFRGQGIGKQVLQFAVEKAEALNCYKVALMTGSNREEVLNFYASAGFSADKVGFQIRF